jgi:hypothetical protein
MAFAISNNILDIGTRRWESREDTVSNIQNDLSPMSFMLPAVDRVSHN